MGFEVLYSIVDGKGKQSTTEINLPGALSITEGITFAVEMAKLIDPLIRGAITRIGLAFLVDLPSSGIKSAPIADSDVEEGARFQFRTENGFQTGMRIPTFNEAKVNVGSDTVDISDAQVASFINAMLTGIDIDPSPTEQLVRPTDKRGELLTLLNFAREAFQSSRGRVG